LAGQDRVDLAEIKVPSGSVFDGRRRSAVLFSTHEADIRQAVDEAIGYGTWQRIHPIPGRCGFNNQDWSKVQALINA
jgi:hypothetical protein